MRFVIIFPEILNVHITSPSCVGLHKSIDLKVEQPRCASRAPQALPNLQGPLSRVILVTLVNTKMHLGRQFVCVAHKAATRTGRDKATAKGARSQQAPWALDPMGLKSVDVKLAALTWKATVSAVRLVEKAWCALLHQLWMHYKTLPMRVRSI